MMSIRRRLMLGAVLAVAVSSTSASGIAWFSVRSHLIQAAETGLKTDARQLLGQLRRRADEVHWAGSGMGVATPDFAGWWVVINANGVVIARSSPAALAVTSLADGPAMMPNDQPGRVVRTSGPILEAGGRGHWGSPSTSTVENFTLIAARTDSNLAATLTAVAWALGTATAVATLLAGFAAWILARAVVQPIARIAGAIAAAKPDDQRIAVQSHEVPSELSAVVERADAFLVMSHDLLRRERQTAANIAHELRTPLAGLSAIIDLALARERTPADYREAFNRSRAVVTDTTRIIEQLLLLTRLESGRETARTENLDLQLLVNAALTIHVPAGNARRQTLDMDTSESFQVTGDRGHAEVVLRNLLDNAISHAPEGSTITLRLINEADRVQLQISNPAGMLTNEHLSRLAEPFWRGDTARKDTGRHAGLGLALCQRLAALNGWRLIYGMSEERFVVSVIMSVAR